VAHRSFPRHHNHPSLTPHPRTSKRDTSARRFRQERDDLPGVRMMDDTRGIGQRGGLAVRRA